MRQEVLDYVDNFVSQGYDYQTVRKQLQQRGYSEEELHELDRIYVERVAPKIAKKAIFYVLLIVGICAVAVAAYYLYPHLKPCTPDWSCSDWNPTTCPKSELQTRTCTDMNSCDKDKNKPAVNQSCTYVCVEDWDCSDWSRCTDEGTQERTCSDKNSCGTLKNTPIVQQSCTPPCEEDWECGAWTPSSCVDGSQTRSCNDKNKCGTILEQPDTWRTCAVCLPDWDCTAWEDCKGGKRERECQDLNNCGTLEGKPTDDEICVDTDNNNTNST